MKDATITLTELESQALKAAFSTLEKILIKYGLGSIEFAQKHCTLYASIEYTPVNDRKMDS